MYSADGRNIYNEGETVVKRAVRKALDSGLFIVFIILDNPAMGDSSITDITTYSTGADDQLVSNLVIGDRAALVISKVFLKINISMCVCAESEVD